jgi:hypothetical protein
MKLQVKKQYDIIDKIRFEYSARKTAKIEYISKTTYMEYDIRAPPL